MRRRRQEEEPREVAAVRREALRKLQEQARRQQEAARQQQQETQDLLRRIRDERGLLLHGQSGATWASTRIEVTDDTVAAKLEHAQRRIVELEEQVANLTAIIDSFASHEVRDRLIKIASDLAEPA